MEAAQKNEQPDKAEAVRAARKATAGKGISPEGANAAVEWFLADEEPVTKKIEINVGSEDEKHWIPWVIEPVDEAVLRRISQASSGNVGRRRGAGTDEVQANLAIVVAGTIEPDLKQMAQQRGVAAPDEVLRMRFARKPGLLGQIAQEILAISGYDDADLRDPATVGNS